MSGKISGVNSNPPASPPTCRARARLRPCGHLGPRGRRRHRRRDRQRADHRYRQPPGDGRAGAERRPGDQFRGGLPRSAMRWRPGPTRSPRSGSPTSCCSLSGCCRERHRRVIRAAQLSQLSAASSCASSLLEAANISATALAFRSKRARHFTSRRCASRTCGLARVAGDGHGQHHYIRQCRRPARFARQILAFGDRVHDLVGHVPVLKQRNRDAQVPVALDRAERIGIGEQAAMACRRGPAGTAARCCAAGPRAWRHPAARVCISGRPRDTGSPPGRSAGPALRGASPDRAGPRTG